MVTALTAGQRYLIDKTQQAWGTDPDNIDLVNFTLYTHYVTFPGVGGAVKQVPTKVSMTRNVWDMQSGYSFDMNTGLRFYGVAIQWIETSHAVVDGLDKFIVTEHDDISDPDYYFIWKRPDATYQKFTSNGNPPVQREYMPCVVTDYTPVWIERSQWYQITMTLRSVWNE